MTSYIANCREGYYGWERRVYVDKRLSDHESAQAGVRFNADGTIFLVSYETIVCEIMPDGWFHCYGTFSRTTIKHIGWFLREYAPSLSYFDAKRCYEKDLEINVRTGETRPAALGMIQTVGVRV